MGKRSCRGLLSYLVSGLASVLPLFMTIVSDPRKESIVINTTHRGASCLCNVGVLSLGVIDPAGFSLRDQRLPTLTSIPQRKTLCFSKRLACYRDNLSVIGRGHQRPPGYLWRASRSCDPRVASDVVKERDETAAATRDRAAEIRQ